MLVDRAGANTPTPAPMTMDDDDNVVLVATQCSVDVVHWIAAARSMMLASSGSASSDAICRGVGADDGGCTRFEFDAAEMLEQCLWDSDSGLRHLEQPGAGSRGWAQ